MRKKPPKRYTVDMKRNAVLPLAFCLLFTACTPVEPSIEPNNVSCYELEDGSQLLFEHGNPDAKVTLYEKGEAPFTILGSMRNDVFVYADGTEWVLRPEQVEGVGGLIDGLLGNSISCSEVL